MTAAPDDEPRARVGRPYDALEQMHALLAVRLHRLDDAGSATVDAGDFVRDVCAGLREHASRRGVALAVLATCGGVRVHVRELAEALFNLVDNAVETAERGASVAITVRAASDCGDMLWEVVDDGVTTANGRPANTNGATRPALGVVLAQLAVESRGGVLHYEATGNGTTARVWLPKARA